LINLRKIVFSKVSPLCSNLFYEEAPQDTAYPYVVFSFPSNGRAYKGQVQRELELAIYDAPKSGYNVATAIDNLADEITRVLDYTTGAQGDLSAWFKFEQRTEIPFPDGTTMWGRILRFTAHTYKE
jgi:hypothetical protein